MELLLAWRAGDNDAGSRLLRRHFRALYRFFRSKVTTGVEDLVQQTMLACADGVHRFRGDASFKTYLLAIARTQLLMHLRKHARKGSKVVELETSVADVLGSPSLEVAGKDEQRLVLMALRHIPVDLQIAVELHYWEGLRGPELAAALEIPEGTVRSRLRRALEALRAALAAAGRPPAPLGDGDPEAALDAWAAALAAAALDE